MTVAAAQAAHFFREITLHESVWTIRDDGGFPAPKNRSGERAMPFWSLESRAARVIANVPAYHGFTIERLTLGEFVEDWLTGLERDDLLVGVNWSGARAVGYDMTPDQVRARLAAVSR